MIDLKATIVEKLLLREGATVSMHLVVPFENKDKVMDGDFLTDGIPVNGWFMMKSGR